MLQLRLLGSPKINLNNVSVAEALSSKAQAILYYLAVTGQPQTRPALAALLWGDMPEEAARTNLRKALANLRETLGNQLDIDRRTVAFQAGSAVWVDVVEFKAHLDAATDIKRLQAAVALYQGDFLAGFYVLHAPDFETWLLAEQARLRELVVQALHTLADHLAGQGELAEAIAYTRQLLSLEPWREEAHRQLMELLAQVGQRSAALAQYEICRQVLADELGVEPDRETINLYERIREGEINMGDRFTPAPLPPRSWPLRATSPAPPLHLPPQPTSFVGREKELAEIRHLLLEESACRLLTLVGPGGIGKTRLALAAAAEVVATFPHGVYFVSLAPVSRAEFVVTAVAEALNLNFSGAAEPKRQLLNYLRGKKLLLVLDNFEHLIPSPEEVGEDGIELFSGILGIAPEATLLVTSRERLHLQEEWGYEVQAMEVPTIQGQSFEVLAAYSAVQLFLQRARRAEASFDLRAEDMWQVVRICQLVGGMPLGLELAASWVGSMTCQEIAQEIERSLDFLTTSMRNMPERHRSLRAVFEQSWQRLPEAEQLVLSKLSVFKGGCLRQATEEVAGASLPVLASLIDRALLHRTDDGRYEMHELLRQYAAEKLQLFGEIEATQAAHANYYAAFLRQRETDLKGGRQLKALAEIVVEIDNVRASWRWAVERKNAAALRKSLDGLFLFYEMQGLAQEGEAAFRRAATAFGELPAAALNKEQTIVYGQLLGRQGNMAVRIGRYEEGIELMRQGALLLHHIEPEAGGELAWALCYWGEEIYFQGDYRQAQQLLQESLQLAAKAGDEWLLGIIWQCLGQTAEFQGEYVEAEPYFRQSLGAFEKLGERRAKSFTQNNWGRVAYAVGEYSRAEQLLTAALQIREELQDKVGIAYSCLDLGKLATMRGLYGEARKQIERGLSICQEIGERDLMARCLNGLGAASRLMGNYVQAEAEHQQSLSIYNEIGVKREIPFTLNNLGRVAFDQGDYQRAQECFQESLRFSQELENKAELASSLRHLGHITAVLEHDTEAQQYYRQALEIVAKTGAVPVTLDIFCGWALLLSRRELLDTEHKQVIELLTLVQHHPAATHETQKKAAERLLELAAEMPAEVIKVVKTRRQTSDWQALTQLGHALLTLGSALG